MTALRPRRVIVIGLLVSGLLALCFLKRFSPSAETHLSTSPHDAPLPDEIFGLLWLVTAPEEKGRTIATQSDDASSTHGAGSIIDERTGAPLGGPVDPEKPIDLAWYALGSIAAHGVRGAALLDDGTLPWPGSAKWGWGRVPVRDRGGWEERMRVLSQEHPLIVFSKTYCPYSARAKKLLERYDLTPRPKIIEVDERPDAAHVKTVLARLTRHVTFPNIILHGHSLGGSDDLARMHEEGVLHAALETGGLKVGRNGEGQVQAEVLV